MNLGNNDIAFLEGNTIRVCIEGKVSKSLKRDCIEWFQDDETTHLVFAKSDELIAKLGDFLEQGI